ncbi:hypothetical protein AB0C69_23105 [Actinomadura sp. NPDC048032]|uniref:hypothetical protein n=1 Tax=Actinomadura sp. NPDC048032 TaxID=3155747 RepID=UPI003411275E
MLYLAEAFTGPRIVAYLLGAAMAVGLVTARRRGPIGLRALAVPWLLLPATVLLLVSQLHPFYTSRYVIGSLPAMALPAAAGLARLPYRTWFVPLVAMAVLVAPLHVEQRRPENWWDDLRGAAAIVEREARPVGVLILGRGRAGRGGVGGPGALPASRDLDGGVGFVRLGRVVGGRVVRARRLRGRRRARVLRGRPVLRLRAAR